MNRQIEFKKLKYLFGPVISRRLGISLGIDLVPPKSCPLNCIYCEAGPTTNLIKIRQEFFPLDEIKKEIDLFLKQCPEVNFVTFSGAGEPTLYLRLGEIIDWLKIKHSKQKICLLTNGILIGEDNMPKELKNLDLIIPSLDAADEITFKKINKPAPGLSLDSLVNSIKNFRSRSKCRMWLEVFIIPSLNDSDESIANFAKIISEIKPDKIQLNGLDRPGVEKWIQKPDIAAINKFTNALSGIAPVENIVRNMNDAKFAKQKADIPISILKLLERRPCTAEEIMKIFSLNENAYNEIIEKLIASKKIKLEKTPDGTFLVNIQ